jgi:hypothetical protein
MIFIPMLLYQLIFRAGSPNLHTVYIVPARREGDLQEAAAAACSSRRGTMANDCSGEGKIRLERRGAMDSIYKIIDVVGTSKTSWEDAAKNAVETAGKSLEDLRVGEVVKLDLVIEKGKVVAYRARVNISFKYRA